ncbi:MAG: Helix-turn-helix domain [Pseudomonadota bacterium]
MMRLHPTMPNLHASLLRVSDVARLLSVPDSTVRWWTRIGRLPHVRMGPRTPRYRPEDVAAFVEARFERGTR